MSLVNGVSKFRHILTFNLKYTRKYFQAKMTHTISTSRDNLLDGYDDVQVKYMEEPCILVNDQDKITGTASKKECHLLENIYDKKMLHRAFSVFLFNTCDELLLQQRSDDKITFPGLLTNTCCSHPLSFELEMDEKDAMGVRRAAQRKLHHELGITPDQVPLNIFQYITRIRYMARNIPEDGKFGENEIDYVLFVKKDVELKINPNEVKSCRYVDKDELRKLLKEDESEVILTPWFRMICNTFLFDWWEELNKQSLSKLQDHKVIHLLE